MQTTLLTDLTVKEICEGFVYNQLEGKGLFGWSGKLTNDARGRESGIFVLNSMGDSKANALQSQGFG